MEAPETLRYSEEHEWVRVADGVAVIGITDHAQEELGDIVFVELPEVGTQVEIGDSFGVVESVKAVSDLYAPMGGEVVEVNAALLDTPERVNEAPYAGGWMVTFAPSDPGQLEELLDAAAYRAYVAERD